MYSIVFLVAAFLATITFAEYHPFSDEYIAEINKKQSTWKAGRNFDVTEWDRFKLIASGVRLNPLSLKNLKHVVHNENQPIPEFFDFRQLYPDCVSIQEIYDQANCGSCYAFCAVEVMSDRICMRTGKNVIVSAEDALECCAHCGTCKRGGDPVAVFKYWGNNGITTGGHYNRTNEGCKPYFLPDCGSNCPTETATIPACQKKCASSELDYNKELTFGDNNAVYLLRNETQIQLEMLKNGPVSTTFLVPADFGTYKSGIYQKTTDQIVGSHCLKIVGWGNENGLKYWIIANSWGKAWGENGFFRIIRGRNESGIEGAVMVSLPKLDLSFNQN